MYVGSLSELHILFNVHGSVLNVALVLKMKDKNSLLVIEKSIQDESISSVFWKPLDTNQNQSKIEEMIQEHVDNNELLEPTLNKV